MTSLMSPRPPFRLDTMATRRQSGDASNLAPRTELVLALPVAVVQGNPRQLRDPLEFRVGTLSTAPSAGKFNLQQADVKRERLV